MTYDMTVAATKPADLSGARGGVEIAAIPQPVRIAATVAVLAALIVLQLTVGAVWVPLDQVWIAITGGDVERVTWSRLILDYRLPRALTALAAGASLGVCGLLLQTVFRNPLADPWLLGLVHGSRLGVAILIVVAGWAGGGNILAEIGLFSATGLVIAGAAGAGAMAVLLGALAPRLTPVTLLLSGVILGQGCIGLISIALHFTDETQARAFQSWDDGAFTQVAGSRLIALAAVAFIALAAAAARTKALNTLLLGDNYARSLGLRVGRTRVLVLAVAAALAGAVTAFCGPVVFIGLLAPHVARAVLQTSNHGRLLPMAALTGAILASLADLITHLPWSTHVLHLNAVTGLIGAPFVLWMLWQRHARLGTEG